MLLRLKWCGCKAWSNLTRHAMIVHLRMRRLLWSKVSLHGLLLRRLLARGLLLGALLHGKGLVKLLVRICITRVEIL